MLPAPNEDTVDGVPTGFARGCPQVIVQQRKQLKHGLDVLLAEGFLPVFQFPELSIGEEQLEEAVKHRQSLGFPLLEMGDRGHFPPLPGPDKVQGLAQSSRELFQHPVLHGGVLQHVADFMGHPAQQGQVLRVFLGILPELPLVFRVLHPGKFRLVRVPAAGGEVVSVGLLCQKIRVQAVAQLMGEKPQHHLVPLSPGGKFGDGGIPGVDGDIQIVGVGQVRALRLPKQANPHPAAGAVALCLGGDHILQVEGKKPTGKKLLVGDSPPLLLDELLDLFVVDSCHAATPYAVFLRLGAKTGSSTEVMSASRSSSSAVALLMMVSKAAV